MSELSASPVVGSDEVPAYGEAFQSVLEEIRALPKEQVLQINVEVPATVTTVMGSLPQIRALRQRVVDELPKFPIERFDKLETYAGALAHAHTLYMAETRPPEPVAELVKECMRMREVLLSDARALAVRGIIDGSRLNDLKGNNSYRFIAFDLFTLVQTLSGNREQIEGKTALQPGDLQRGQMLGEKLTRSLGERDQAPPALEEASDNRDRAFTLLDKTYSDVQHAVYFLAPDQASDIAPTIYAGGRPAGRKKPAEPEAPATGDTSATGGTPAAPATPAATGAPVAPAVAAPPIAPGLPGAAPFISAK